MGRVSGLLVAVFLTASSLHAVDGGSWRASVSDIVSLQKTGQELTSVDSSLRLRLESDAQEVEMTVYPVVTNLTARKDAKTDLIEVPAGMKKRGAVLSFQEITAEQIQIEAARASKLLPLVQKGDKIQVSLLICTNAPSAKKHETCVETKEIKTLVKPSTILLQTSHSTIAAKIELR